MGDAHDKPLVERVEDHSWIHLHLMEAVGALETSKSMTVRNAFALLRETAGWMCYVRSLLNVPLSSAEGLGIIVDDEKIEKASDESRCMMIDDREFVIKTNENESRKTLLYLSE